MDDIAKLLDRGVDKIYPSRDALKQILETGTKLKLYQGFDPTGTELHIGHMVGLRKLAQWQKLGHHVIFLIGDGTGQAGDPSGKKRSREKFLSRDQLKKNAKDYVMQAGKLIDFDAPNVEILYNGDWLNDLSLPEILEIMDHISVQQLDERDLFQERKKAGEVLKLREYIYPLLQAYDSVMMDVDLELGGTDQTFNMLMGRSLMRAMKNKDKFVMTTPLLTDSQGNKIGKTEGNVIALSDNPTDLYRKVMALSDDIVAKGLEYLTDVSMDEIKKIDQEIANGENPINFKKKLAHGVVKQLSSDNEADEAQREFERVVQKGEIPSNVPSISVRADRLIDADLLVELNLATSKSDAKRLFEQNAVALNGSTIKSGQALADEPGEGILLSVGKRMVKLMIENG